MADAPVVTVTATIQSGAVVRWYRDAYDSAGPCLSASRNGVMIHGDQWLTGPDAVPVQWMADATEAAIELGSGRDVKHLATHRRVGLLGPLEPVAGGAHAESFTPGGVSSLSGGICRDREACEAIQPPLIGGEQCGP